MNGNITARDLRLIRAINELREKNPPGYALLADIAERLLSYPEKPESP